MIAMKDLARKQLESVTKKWSEQYPSAMNRWHENWDAISPIFKFSKDVRTAFYTTNAIESLNSCYRRLNKQRSVFPSLLTSYSFALAEVSLITDFGDLTFPSLITIPSANKGLIISFKN